MQRERILTFYIGDEIYGIHTDHIKEINQLSAIRLHEEPQQVIVRNQAIPLVCLRTKLALPKAYFPAQNCVLIIRTMERSLALIVDGIHQVSLLDPHHLSPLLPIQGTQPILLGSARIGTQKVLLIDALACFKDIPDISTAASKQKKPQVAS